MRQGNGRGDLLGSIVGGYRLERLLGEDGSATVYLGALVEQARAGLSLPAQAQITVYPVPPALPAEEQVAARARFERAVAAAQQGAASGAHAAPPLIASGEDAAAGLLYVIMPAPGMAAMSAPEPSTGFAAPPPTLPTGYAWPAPPSAPVAGMPIYPQGSPLSSFIPAAPVAPTRRRQGVRFALALVLIVVVCVGMSAVVIVPAAFFVTARSLIGTQGYNSSYHVLTGCAAPGADVTAGLTPPTSALPDAKQVLRIQNTGASDVQTLDPADAFDTNSQQYASLIFPGLVTLDHNQCAIPWAARALPDLSADGMTYTFHLRRGLTWSDGVPITAQTFAYAINRVEDPCSALSGAYYLYDIQDAADFNAENCDSVPHVISGKIATLIGDSLLTPDPLTLQITLGYPVPYFLAELAYPASHAVPQQLIQRYGNAFTQRLADGAGFGGDLFKVTRWDHKGHLTLQRNDAFWGAKPALRELDVTFYQDPAAAYRAYLAGKADVGSAPAALLAKARAHATFRQVATQQIDYYAMNWKMAPFDDIRMRQAFAIALDKSALAAIDGAGVALPTNHIVPQGLTGYNPDLLGPDGTENLHGNIQLANQLATAYAAKTGCGVATDFSKCPLVTLTTTPDSQSVARANAARRMWLKAMPHYPILIATDDFNTLSDFVSNGSAQFWEFAWIGDYPDPQDWLSTNLGCYGGYNDGNACDSTADTLMNTADESPDQATRLRDYQRAEQLMVTAVGWIPLSQATTWWETRPTVHNYAVSPASLIPNDTWQTIYLTAK